MSGQDFAPPSLLANSPARRRRTISLTPLIDVVFILIVFFMLASSFFDWRSLTLDAPVQSSGGSAMEGAMLVELRPDGLRLSGEDVTADRLIALVAARLAKTPGQRVLVKPATGVSVQQVVGVVDRLAEAGVSNMSLVREGAQ
ncbi:MAG: biopolymer transporter ExbD [Rhodospirillaceae bacterium]